MKKYSAPLRIPSNHSIITLAYPLYFAYPLLIHLLSIDSIHPLFSPCTSYLPSTFTYPLPVAYPLVLPTLHLRLSKFALASYRISYLLSIYCLPFTFLPNTYLPSFAYPVLLVTLHFAYPALFVYPPLSSFQLCLISGQLPLYLFRPSALAYPLLIAQLCDCCHPTVYPLLLLTLHHAVARASANPLAYPAPLAP